MILFSFQKYLEKGVQGVNLSHIEVNCKIRKMKTMDYKVGTLAKQQNKKSRSCYLSKGRVAFQRKKKEYAIQFMVLGQLVNHSGDN